MLLLKLRLVFCKHPQLFLLCLYTRKKDEYAEVSKQIAFYREKVIPHEDKFLRSLANNGDRREYLHFDSDSFDEICKSTESLDILKRQYAISVKNSIEGERPVSADEVDVLNMMEEFSIMALQYNTKNHPSLCVLHSIFVLGVEVHASRIFYIREIEHGKPLYNHLLEMYFLWKNKVDNRTVNDRLRNSKNWQGIVRRF